MKSILIVLFFLFTNFFVQAENKTFKIGFIDLQDDIRYSDWGRHPVDIRSSHSEQQRPVDGARLGIVDAEKFERITKTKFILKQFRFEDDKTLLTFLNSERPNEFKVILLDLNIQNFKNIRSSIKEKSDIIFFNISNPHNSLRAASCINNLYHTYPSNMMKTDAISQFLVKKKWNKTLILTGSLNEDIEMSQSFKESSKKFGVKIVDEKIFVNSNDPRVREKNDLSFLTKGKKFKSIFIADVDGEFSLGVPYSTMRPVAILGASGLHPKSWHWSYMRHGAPQVNGRFERNFSRRMNDKDWASWIAIKSVMESIIRTKSTETKVLTDFLESDEFKVDGSKGISLSYRNNTNQLRQPILLVASNNWVTAVAPLESFKNRKNNLETLGLLNKEKKC
jgi:ABC transporter substrate binding protein (PQQ-dependent alcohol dehydrogenase system)